MSHQMALEHLEPLTVLKAHNIVGLDRRAHRYLRFLADFGCGRRAGKRRKCTMHVRDQLRQVIDRHAVIADVRCNYVRCERDQRVIVTLIVHDKIFPSIKCWRTMTQLVLHYIYSNQYLVASNAKLTFVSG